MRVLLVTKGLDLGGIERVVTDLATGLHGDGIDVEVALVNSNRDRLVPTIEAAGVTVHRLDGTDTIGVGAGRRLARLVRAGSYDVVHVHGPLPAIVARIAAAAPGARGATRVVTTSHTPWHSLHLATRTAWRATAGLDAATIAVSAAVAASLPARVASNAVVIPHGIDPARIAAARHAANCAQFSTGPGDVVRVVAVASHRDAKNYPNLLRGVRAALDGGAPIQLVTIGDGPNLDAHVALAAELGIDHAVTFAPSTDDVLAAIAGADILAVASDYEGQPIVVAEALALGVPVVATAVGRVPEMVNSDVGRVVVPSRPRSARRRPRRTRRLGGAAGDDECQRPSPTQCVDPARRDRRPRRPVSRTRLIPAPDVPLPRRLLTANVVHR